MISREPVPLRSRPASRRWLVVLVVVVFAVLLTLRQAATFWTDYLWFSSVDQTDVWITLITTRIWLVLGAALVAFSLLWLNLLLADRLSPRGEMTPAGPDEELVERFHEWIEPRVAKVRFAVAAVFGLLIGLGAGAWWEDYLLFANGGDFGLADPQFGNDIGFYVFELPLMRDLFSWGFQFFLVTTLIVAALHYLNGGIQIGANIQRVGAGVKLHLSILFAVLALLKAFGYWLDRFDLLFSPRGQVFGASFTDINARLPALNLLILISLFAAVLLLVNIRFRGWTLPIVAIGLWLATSVILGGIYPAVVQRFRVEPDEVNKELPFVNRNIQATRQGYGLDRVEVRPFAADGALDANALVANADTIDNLRLWDPSVLRTTYRQLQELREFYRFEDVDVDRYVLEDGLTQVMLSARELEESNIPSGWVNGHLVYTHGFGAVLSPANAVTAEGQPEFLLKDVPPQAAEPKLATDEPRIYFGETFDEGSFVFVATKEPEFDFPLESGSDAVQYTSYSGRGGIRVDNILKRAALALRFGDFNTLISGQITNNSRALLVRNIKERVQKVMPLLYPDGDPYLVLRNGRLEWILDLYAISDRFPYSQPAVTARLSGPRATLPNGFNYIRNSVKAVIDAYDGTMTFYVIDSDDPLIQTYQRIFPSVFTPESEIPEDLRDNLRYPEDLFRIQSDMYNQYHVMDPRIFFTGTERWAIARDPSDTDEGPLRNASLYRDNQGPYKPMLPYYLLMRLPGEEQLSFLILQPFVPANRPNMISFLVAKSGPDQYGQLVDFQLPRDRLIDGPGQVGARINQNPEISQQFTLLDQQGSDVIQGNMLVVPVKESLVYVQPIYISARSTATATNRDAAALPEFKFAVVVFENRIAMRERLEDALEVVFGAAGPVVPPDDGTPPPDPGDPLEVPEEVRSLLDQASAAFTAAEDALRAGDLATYAAKVDEAQGFLEQARQLIGTLNEGVSS